MVCFSYTWSLPGINIAALHIRESTMVMVWTQGVCRGIGMEEQEVHEMVRMEAEGVIGVVM